MQFSIWESDTERSHAGLLLVSVNGGPRENICRKKNSVQWYPDYRSAGFICQRLGFHQVSDTGSTEDTLPFRAHYKSGMYKLECINTTYCVYVAKPGCNGDHFYTYIKCGCNGNSYTTSDGCVSCPAFSDPITNPVHRCSCATGLYWSSDSCIPCPAYTYSPDNSTTCDECPKGATSSPESGSCDCFAGLYKKGEVCLACSGNTFSKRGSESCTSCPPGSIFSPDHSYCTCEGAALWDPVLNTCTDPTCSDGSTDYQRQADDCVTQSPHILVTVLLFLILATVLCGFGLLVFCFVRRRRYDQDGVVVMNRLQVPPPVPPGPPSGCVGVGLEEDYDRYDSRH